VPGHPVVEAGADRDQQVALLHQQVRRLGSVHAEHAEVVRVAGVHCAEGLGGGGGRDAGRPREGAQLRRRPRGHHPAAHVQHRAPRRGDEVASGGDGVGRRGRHVVVDRRRRAGGGVERGCVEGRELRVLGDVDEDRAGAAGAGEAEGGVEDAGEVRDVAHEVAVLGAGERQAEDVHLLEGVRADER